MGRHRSHDEWRQIVDYARAEGPAAAASRYGVHRQSVYQWTKRFDAEDSEAAQEAADEAASQRAARSIEMEALLGVNVVDAVQTACDESGVAYPLAIGALFGGLFLPNEEPVENLAMVYRISDAVDLGGKRPRPGATGGGSRSKNQQSGRASHHKGARRKGMHA